jgi:hypothetical protein
MNMENPEKNKSLYPTDKTMSDDIAQDRAEKEATETIVDPKLPEENDEGAFDGHESRRIDPESKYPKSTFSAWYKHLEGLSLCHDEYKRQIAEACLDPRIFPACASSAESGWNFLRHGLDEFPSEQKIVDDKIELAFSKAVSIGDDYARGRIVYPITIKPDLDNIRSIWRDIFSTMNKLGLSFRFRKPNEEEMLLRRRLREDPLRKNIVKAKGEDLNPVTKPLEVKK